MSGRERGGRLFDRASGDRDVAVDTGYAALATGLVAALVLPLGWLVVDATTLGSRVVELTLDSQTLAVLGRSVALVAVVTSASALVGVPLAVLTVQASVPFRQHRERDAHERAGTRDDSHECDAPSEDCERL